MPSRRIRRCHFTADFIKMGVGVRREERRTETKRENQKKSERVQKEGSKMLPIFRPIDSARIWCDFPKLHCAHRSMTLGDLRSPGNPSPDP